MGSLLEPVVWIIDREQWPRAYIRAELIERGWRAIGFVELRHALSAFLLGIYPRPQVIVLELFALGAEETEVEHLVNTGIPIVLLGGAVQLGQAWVKGLKWAGVMRRPFTIGEVADSVERILVERQTAGPV